MLCLDYKQQGALGSWRGLESIREPWSASGHTPGLEKSEEAVGVRRGDLPLRAALTHCSSRFLCSVLILCFQSTEWEAQEEQWSGVGRGRWSAICRPMQCSSPAAVTCVHVGWGGLLLLLKMVVEKQLLLILLGR